MVYVLTLTTRFLLVLEPVMTSERCQGEKQHLFVTGGRAAVGKSIQGQSHAGRSSAELGGVLQG